MTRWRYAAATDTGLVRETNQDAIFVDDSLAIVADGMGGHAAGEVASAMTVDAIYEGYLQDPTVAGLQAAIETANRSVLQEARENPNHFGMGTTVIVVGLTHDERDVTTPTLFHVGDSRAYQLRDGALRQLSDDHSVAEEWVRMGRLTPEEALTHPRRHQLTRGVGVEEKIDVDVMSVIAQSGDRLLLCSDGLSNELSNETLARLASAPVPLDDAVSELVEAAKQAGGRDNISVVLLEFDESDAPSRPIKKTIGSSPPPLETSAGAGRRTSRRRHRLTWRFWVAVLFLLGVFGGAYGVLHWYAYSSYYLANDSGFIAVYQGQPKGVLWFKPVKVFDTTLLSTQISTVDQVALGATIPEPTLDTALKYANAMHRDWHPTTSSTTTTTTTPGAVATTTVKRG